MTKHTPHPGGRPPRTEPKSTPIWCGQMTQAQRQHIITHTTPDERRARLLALANWNLKAGAIPR